jgi:hypothetical protein
MNITGMVQKLVCPIQFQFLLVSLDLLNGLIFIINNLGTMHRITVLACLLDVDC